ncbi:MAG: extracellular solute-binding protein [Treponema sp.]|jgi:spermidine/putrescine transport system substrate-binding protein|nr:extracellular solute-binding protein [Treponema sp.]
MRKISVLLAAAGLAAALLGGCADKTGAEESGRAESNTLYIYNWLVYTPDTVIEKFENEYGVTVIYDEFDSNESMYAKLRAGGSGYDIVFPSQDYASIMINQNMLKKLDKSKLSNLENVSPEVLEKTTFDPGMDYSVPYFWGAAGITVNTARVPVYEKSWSIFGRADLKGHMTMLDDMREVLGDALISLGYSANSSDPAQLDRAAKLVNDEWKPNLTKFDAEAFGEGYAKGDFWVVQGYPEVVALAIAGNPELIKNTVFFIPPEGGPAYIDYMCIPEGAKNVELAHKFINFIHRPEIYAEFCNSFGFPATANSKAGALLQGTLLYEADELPKMELKYDLGESLELYDKVWQNIKVW